ncbi:hypothetical protein CTI12_AA311970 [Artemisia annua]|uniref:Zinc finger, RING/FYVE/PHD-type n=1 Tax=Artemisia annua TaxID=35608 RepID=A0A2U1N3C7_ARTAN|nr:hypothetical protein CTI12_AA311970 [Artemisia annua]
MPKDRRSSSLDRCRLSPCSWCYPNAVTQKPRSLAIPVGNEKEWEEARCPICMEHPHNAVLLLCSSREKGCRPYMCDTSYRHSNCLDQFLKSAVNKGADAKLVCPLCRGQINECIKNNPARQFMDSKTRRCSMDTCNYTGNYLQLRKHAKCKHPHVRPTDVDPERELEWRNLEESMELQDLYSMDGEDVDPGLELERMISMQFDYHEIDDEDIEEELTDGQDMDGEDVDPGLKLERISMQFDFHEIGIEDIEEELTDAQDMDGEGVDPGLELERMISMQFDYHEIDDEDIEEELTDGQDMDGEDVDPGLELERMISMQFDFHEIGIEDIEKELTDGQDMDGEDVDPGLELERMICMQFDFHDDYYEFDVIGEPLDGDSDLYSPNMNNIH